MSYNLRSLPRVNYHWKVQERISEDNRHLQGIQTGKPRQRGSHLKTMALKDGLRTPGRGNDELNISILTNIDDADFQNMSKDDLIKKLNIREAKLKIYEKNVTEGKIKGMDTNKVKVCMQRIEDQIEYLEEAGAHAKSIGCIDLKDMSEDLQGEMYNIVKFLKEYIDDVEEDIAHTGKLRVEIQGQQTNAATKKSIPNPTVNLYQDTEALSSIKPLGSSTPSKHQVHEKDNMQVYTHMSLLEQRVDLLVMVTKRIIIQELTTNISEDKLRSLQSTDLPKLEETKNQLSKLFDEYVVREGYENLCSTMLASIKNSVHWIQSCCDLIKEARLDITDDSKNNIEAIKLLPFDGWKGNIDVYVFVEDFNRLLSSARTSTKLSALYKNYLTKDIDREVEHLYLDEDYNGMIDYLIRKYGSARRILDNKKKQLQGLNYSKDIDVQIKYFRTFHHVLINLEALLKKHSHEVKDLGNEVYNQSFLQSIAHFLPDDHKMSLIKFRSKEERRCKTRLSEKEEFEMFQTYISIELGDLETLSLEHGCTQEEGKEEKSNSIGIHTVDVKDVSNNDKKEIYNQEKKPFEFRGVAVKCPMHDFIVDFRSHPVGKCSAFLNATPENRLEKIQKLKICTTCLGDWCGRNKTVCCNIRNVPTALICSDCGSIDPKHAKNVLLCLDHQQDMNSIARSLDYLHGYDSMTKIVINN